MLTWMPKMEFSKQAGEKTFILVEISTILE
jgi:hypothetical protein